MKRDYGLYLEFKKTWLMLKRSIVEGAEHNPKWRQDIEEADQAFNRVQRWYGTDEVDTRGFFGE